MTGLKSAREVVADFFAGTVTSFRSNLSGVGRAALLAAAVGAAAPIAAPSTADAASARGARQQQAPRADAGVARRPQAETSPRFLDEVLIEPENIPSVPKLENLDPIAPEYNATYKQARSDLFTMARQAETAGLPSEYLIALNLAAEEMSTNAAKGARVRGAGPFRYTEQHWADSVTRFGVAAGFGQYGTQDSKGRFAPTVEMIPRFLAGRENTSIAGALAAASAAVNTEQFALRMHRQPSSGELMIAHFVGLDATVKLAKAAQTGSRVQARALVPDAAKASPALFASGLLPLTAGEVIGVANRIMDDNFHAARDGLTRYSADARDTMDSHIPMRPTA